jgi:hypothetical protein
MRIAFRIRMSIFIIDIIAVVICYRCISIDLSVVSSATVGIESVTKHMTNVINKVNTR